MENALDIMDTLNTNFIKSGNSSVIKTQQNK